MGRSVVTESCWLYLFILIVGGLLANIIVRGLSATTFGILLVNPLAMICSIAGLIVLAIQHLP